MGSLFFCLFFTGEMMNFLDVQMSWGQYDFININQQGINMNTRFLNHLR